MIQERFQNNRFIANIATKYLVGKSEIQKSPKAY
jgi:hypothetical protein